MSLEHRNSLGIKSGKKGNEKKVSLRKKAAVIEHARSAAAPAHKSNKSDTASSRSASPSPSRGGRRNILFARKMPPGKIVFTDETAVSEKISGTNLAHTQPESRGAPGSSPRRARGDSKLSPSTHAGGGSKRVRSRSPRAGKGARAFTRVVRTTPIVFTDEVHGDQARMRPVRIKFGGIQFTDETTPTPGPMGRREAKQTPPPSGDMGELPMEPPPGFDDDKVESPLPERAEPCSAALPGAPKFDSGAEMDDEVALDQMAVEVQCT